MTNSESWKRMPDSKDNLKIEVYTIVDVKTKRVIGYAETKIEAEQIAKDKLITIAGDTIKHSIMLSEVRIVKLREI